MAYTVIRRTPNDSDALPVRCATFGRKDHAEEYAAQRSARMDEFVFDVVHASDISPDGYA